MPGDCRIRLTRPNFVIGSDAHTLTRTVFTVCSCEVHVPVVVLSCHGKELPQGGVYLWSATAFPFCASR